MRRLNLGSDRGSAVIEFIGFGVMLQIPLLLLSIHLVGLQREQFASDSIARHGVRQFVLSGYSESAVLELANQMASDFGFKASDLSLQISNDCSSVNTATVSVSLSSQKSIAKAICQ